MMLAPSTSALSQTFCCHSSAPCSTQAFRISSCCGSVLAMNWSLAQCSFEACRPVPLFPIPTRLHQVSASAPDRCVLVHVHRVRAGTFRGFVSVPLPFRCCGCWGVFAFCVADAVGVNRRLPRATVGTRLAPWVLLGVGNHRLEIVSIRVFIVCDKLFLPQPDFDVEFRQPCWPTAFFQCLRAQRVSHVVKCIAEVHGPEESCISVAPFCCSCFSVCEQVSERIRLNQC